MGKHRFKKSEPVDVQGICVRCGINPQKSQGSGKFKPICRPCSRELQNGDGNKPYRKYKGPVCEECGFVPKHACQLDVDHIDGNHENNDPANLRTLCANCHRLKTYLNKDWEKDKGLSGPSPYQPPS